MPKITRADAIRLLGSRCSHCGERDPKVLDVHHVNHDGHLERKQIKSGFNLFWNIVHHPERYALLCRNCNWRDWLEEMERKKTRKPSTRGNPLLDELQKKLKPYFKGCATYQP